MRYILLILIAAVHLACEDTTIIKPPDPIDERLSLKVLANYNYLDTNGSIATLPMELYQRTVIPESDPNIIFFDRFHTLDSMFSYYNGKDTVNALFNDYSIKYKTSCAQSYYSIASNYKEFSGEGIAALQLDFDSLYIFYFGCLEVKYAKR